MSQDMSESTRVMPAAGVGDRTMVAPGSVPPLGGGFRDPAATQMGATVVCAVCRSTNPALETYCVECGFLLSSSPGASESADTPELSTPELVEAVTGRRFRLRTGPNTVGRENCDILLMEGTVSRRHAHVTLEGGTVTITDLGSTNGTQVDGNRLAPNQPTILSPGGTVRFGNASLTLPVTGPAEATIVSPAPAEATMVVQLESAPEVISELSLIGEPIEAAPEESAPVSPILSPPPSTDAGAGGAVARLKPATDSGQEILIHEGATTVGRRTGNTYIISDDPYISGRHAEISCEANGCYLMDAGSTNGTVVNGQRLEPGQKQLLLDGDTVGIGQGNYTFETLEQPDEDAPEPPPASPPLESHSFDPTPEQGQV